MISSDIASLDVAKIISDLSLNTGATNDIRASNYRKLLANGYSHAQCRYVTEYTYSVTNTPATRTTFSHGNEIKPSPTVASNTAQILRDIANGKLNSPSEFPH